MAKNIQIQLVPVADLKVSSKNPRTVSEANLTKLMKSIEEDEDFLTKRPILVNKVNKRLVVYAGAQRLEACKRLGKTEVPCIVESNLPVHILEYRMLADNTHFGEWDLSKLAEGFDKVLQEDVFADTDFKMERGKHPTKSVGKGNKGDGLYTKLVFQSKEDIDTFHGVLEVLAMEYPTETVSNRLRLFLRH